MQFENEFMEQRHQHRLQLEEMGVDPFPGRCERTHTMAEIHETYGDKDREALADAAIEVAVVGRVMLSRAMGKAGFATLRDGYGDLQIYIRKDGVAETDFKAYQLMDLGDFVGVRGTLFRTKTEELSVKAAAFTLLGKTYRQLPEKFHGLKDKEIRYRQRYLDLLANPEVRDTFMRRSRIVNAIRSFMDRRGYLEVETPMMHQIAGGANARPFTTHHNTLDLPLFLRIALELPLKRLIVGGMERVYEINRNFRNEGISTQHNPEFTMMEWYEAYADLSVMKEMVESMIKQVVEDVVGASVLPYGDHELDFGAPFRSMTMKEAICEYGQIEMAQLDDEDALRDLAASHHIEKAKTMDAGKLLTEVFDAVAEEKLIQPTFITEYPQSVSPLTKQMPGVPGFVERFELFVAGMEVANAYTELNDPVEQRLRFEQQLAEREKGDEEAQMLDEDFLVSMEHGMPPTGGQGLGIDRLVMILTNSPSIRDVILFPLMRPQES